MQKCKTFSAVLNEERQRLQNTVAKIWQSVLPSWTASERALAVEGLTDDVKEELKWSKKVWYMLLKEEGIEEIPANGAFDHNYPWLHQTLPADDEHQQTPSHKSSKRLPTPTASLR